LEDFLSESVLTFSKQLGFSKLFQDFIYHPERTTPFFSPIPLKKRAKAIAAGAQFRNEAVDILSRQNRDWQAPSPVIESISRLSDKKSLAVVAGQQTCLFGGPYLVILKALAVVKLARNLEKELAVPVVPIFWIAADDHDYQEISFVDIFDTSGILYRLSIDTEDKQAGAPIGALEYDESMTREMERLQSVLPANDFRDEALSAVNAIYQPEKNIVDCFAEYLLSLVGQHGLAMFNPYDRQFKQHVGPMMREIISRHVDIKKILKDTETSLTDSGYHVQVQKAITAAHLFYHKPARTAIHFEGNNFQADEHVFSEKELSEAIGSEPFSYSPDVLTRPMLQSYFFPTAAVIGGPAEVAYYSQLFPLYDLLNLTPPTIRARPSITLVENRYQKMLDMHHLNFNDLTGDIEGVINRVLQETFPKKIDAYLAEFTSNSKEEISRLRGQLAEVNPDLASIVDHAGEKLDYQIKQMVQKLFSAHKKRHTIEKDRIYRLHENLYPNRNLAERSIAPVYMVSRYGRGVMDFIFEKMNLDETGHRLLMLSEYHG
jgi:bacillithiol biosynthesis cysteine-adding enzyme BshC